MYQALTEIGIIHQLTESMLRATLPKPLTLAQFKVLTHLSRVPDVNTPTRITNAFQVTKGAMTHTLGLLTKNGFVTIEADERDGRAKHVYITKAGQEIMGNALMAMAPNFMGLSTQLNDAEITALTQSLGKLRVFLDKAREH